MPLTATPIHAHQSTTHVALGSQHPRVPCCAEAVAGKEIDDVKRAAAQRCSCCCACQTPTCNRTTHIQHGCIACTRTTIDHTKSAPKRTSKTPTPDITHAWMCELRRKSEVCLTHTPFYQPTKVTSSTSLHNTTQLAACVHHMHTRMGTQQKTGRLLDLGGLSAAPITVRYLLKNGAPDRPSGWC